MKNLKLKTLKLNATVLTNYQMKNIAGGTGPIGIYKPCFKCCPSDKCSSIRHYCPDIVCPE